MAIVDLGNYNSGVAGRRSGCLAAFVVRGKWVFGSVSVPSFPCLISGDSAVSNADGNNLNSKKESLPGAGDPLEGLEDLESQGPLGDLGDAGAFDEGAPLGDLPAAEVTEEGELPGELSAEAPEESKGAKKNRRKQAAKDKTAKKQAAKEQAAREKAAKKQAAKERAVKEKREKAPSGEGRGMAGIAVMGFCGLSVLLLLALDAMVFLRQGFLFLLLINVFWLIATAIPLVMWLGRETLNFYEVVLGISLAGIVVAVSLLAAEWLVRYGGESKPKVGAAPITTQFGAERTSAVA